jgi:hypothetical protein
MVLLICTPVFFMVLWVVSEFRSPRWLRLSFGTAAILSTAGLAVAIHLMRQVELADNFHRATDHLSYSIEAGIK